VSEHIDTLKFELAELRERLNIEAAHLPQDKVMEGAVTRLSSQLSASEVKIQDCGYVTETLHWF
jgi:hypothetical protein